MNRVSTHIDAIVAWLKALQSADAQPLFLGATAQLDAFDAEDIATQSLQCPHACLTLMKCEAERRADGGIDLATSFAIAVLAKRDQERAADAVALDLAVEVMLALQEQTFNQGDCAPPERVQARLAQKAPEKTGLAIAVVVFEQKLHVVTSGLDGTQGLIGVFPEFTGAGESVNAQDLFGDGLTAEERAVVNAWSD